jgi:hypothetical protein
VGNLGKAFIHNKKAAEGPGGHIEWVIALKIKGKSRGIARDRWRKAEFIGLLARTERVTDTSLRRLNPAAGTFPTLLII